MNLRTARRAVALGLALGASVIRYWATRLRGPLSLPQRALWMRSASRMTLAALGIHCRVLGTPPAHGLVVSNHLSYLDILILSANMPCFFVAKHEIGKWPYFGKAARTGATIFIDRSSRASAANVARQIAQRLSGGMPVLFFPEGTSTDGSEVRRFHSTLFEPAVKAEVPITAVAIRYAFTNGRPERDLCWFDDALFLPHMLKTLAAKGFFAEVQFGESRTYPDRRAAAEATHAEVARMRGSEVNAPPLVTESVK